MELTPDPLGQFRSLSRFAKKHRDGFSQGAPELFWSERAYKRIVELVEDLGRQFVEVLSVPAIKPLSATSKVECLVPYRADPVLSLPVPASLDGDSCVERVVDAVPKQLLRWGRRFVCLFMGLAEQQPERRSAPAELRHWRERQVKLQTVREQEHAVDDRSAR